PKGQEAETIAELAKDPNVEFVEQENYIYPGSIPNDPDFDEQWYLHNTGQTSGKVNADIDAPQAWDKTRGSNDVIIAVLDSGVDKNHPELRGKIVAEKSFVGGSAEDKHGHGTAMAGIAAARGNNNEGISGVCPECSLIIGKVIEPGVAGTDANLAEGIA